VEVSPVTYQLDPECALPPHLIQLFLRKAPEQMRQLVEACEALDADAARAQAHKLKGALFAAGATRLAEDIEALRAELVTSDWPAARQRMSEIVREFAAVLAQLERQLPEGSA
jgi:HPt (histidine-containing phosphotransfer) domain-containing protein